MLLIKKYFSVLLKLNGYPVFNQNFFFQIFLEFRLWLRLQAGRGMFNKKYLFCEKTVLKYIILTLYDYHSIRQQVSIVTRGHKTPYCRIDSTSTTTVADIIITTPEKNDDSTLP